MAGITAFNYIVSWRLPSFSSTDLELTLIFDLVSANVKVNQAENFLFRVFDKRFGSLNSGSVRILQNETLILPQAFFNQGDSQSIQINLDPPFAKDEVQTFQISFQVRDGLCKLENQVGILATWATLLDIDASKIEYDFFVPTILPNEELDLSFEPGSNFAEFSSDESESGFFIPYSKKDLNFDREGTGLPIDVFFTWNQSLIDFPPGTEIAACTLLGELTLAQFVGELVQFLLIIVTFFAGLYYIMCMTPSGQNRRTPEVEQDVGLNFRADIVLTPITRHRTVEAMREEDDEEAGLDDLVPINTFEIHFDAENNQETQQSI